MTTDRLVLFDIDGTLITWSTTSGSVAAVQRAGEELVGPHFDANAVSYAGSLDPNVFADLLRAHDLPSAPEHARALYDVYARHLRDVFDEGIGPEACPGAIDLLEGLLARPRITLGLLTGNLEEAGATKLQTCGYDVTRFTVPIWGDASPHHPPHRRHLPEVALDRWARSLGRRPEPREAVIIGDTPADIDAARHVGLRCIAVATGRFSRGELVSHGPDLALETLEETDAILEWITSDPQ